MTPSPPIMRLSTWLARISTIMLFVLPVIWVLQLIGYWQDPTLLAQQLPQLPPDLPITRPMVFISFAIGAIALGFVIVLMLHLRRLFSLYAAGEVVSHRCAHLIRRAGQILLVLAVLGVILPMLQVMALSAFHPDGLLVLSIKITSQEIGFALVAGLLTVIGWAMGAAGREIESFI